MHEMKIDDNTINTFMLDGQQDENMRKKQAPKNIYKFTEFHFLFNINSLLSCYRIYKLKLTGKKANSYTLIYIFREKLVCCICHGGIYGNEVLNRVESSRAEKKMSRK